MRQETVDRYLEQKRIVPINEKTSRIINSYGRTVSIVSNKYKLINNSELVQPFIDRFGFDNLLTAQQKGNEQYYFTFNTGKDININGEVLKQRIIIANSYDKSRSFVFMAGAFRHYCSNGLYTGNAFEAVKRKHIGEIDVKGIIDSVLTSYDSVDYSLWEKMALRGISESEECNFLNLFDIVPYEKDCSQNYYKNRYVKSHVMRYNSYYNRKKETNTLWGLYNKINWSIAREFNDTLRQSTLNKRTEEAISNFFSIN